METDIDKRGKFIVFEGGEGSGKSSISKWLVERLASEGHMVRWTREPGGSPFAEKIRTLILSDDARHADAETLFALFLAARRDHLKQTIIPHLEVGASVISDRFMSSTWAYQLVAQEQPQLRELFHQMHAHYLDGLEPHYVFLDVPPEVGLRRAKSRPEATTHFDERDVAFHTRVRDGFLEFFSTIPKERITVIDAHEPLERVQERAHATVRSIIG